MTICCGVSPPRGPPSSPPASEPPELGEPLLEEPLPDPDELDEPDELPAPEELPLEEPLPDPDELDEPDELPAPGELPPPASVVCAAPPEEPQAVAHRETRDQPTPQDGSHVRLIANAAHMPSAFGGVRSGEGDVKQ